MSFAKKNQDQIIQKAAYDGEKILGAKCKLHQQTLNEDENLAVYGEVLLDLSIRATL